jgi:hypothetical protein
MIDLLLSIALLFTAVLTILQALAVASDISLSRRGGDNASCGGRSSRAAPQLGSRKSQERGPHERSWKHGSEPAGAHQQVPHRTSRSIMMVRQIQVVDVVTPSLAQLAGAYRARLAKTSSAQKPLQKEQQKMSSFSAHLLDLSHRKGVARDAVAADQELSLYEDDEPQSKPLSWDSSEPPALTTPPHMRGFEDNASFSTGALQGLAAYPPTPSAFSPSFGSGAAALTVRAGLAPLAARHPARAQQAYGQAGTASETQDAANQNTTSSLPAIPHSSQLLWLLAHQQAHAHAAAAAAAMAGSDLIDASPKLSFPRLTTSSGHFLGAYAPAGPASRGPLPLMPRPAAQYAALPNAGPLATPAHADMDSSPHLAAEAAINEFVADMEAAAGVSAHPSVAQHASHQHAVIAGNHSQMEVSSPSSPASFGGMHWPPAQWLSNLAQQDDLSGISMSPTPIPSAPSTPSTQEQETHAWLSDTAQPGGSSYDHNSLGHSGETHVS